MNVNLELLAIKRIEGLTGEKVGYIDCRLASLAPLYYNLVYQPQRMAPLG